MSDSFLRPRHPFLLIATAIGILLVSLAFFGSANAAATLTVDPSNCAIGSGNYCTIQDAIDAAAVGDTINVYPGIYSETAANRGTVKDPTASYQFGLFISTDGLTIQGVKADGTPIVNHTDAAATVTTNATNSFGHSGIFVQANNVTIAGLRIGANLPDNNKTIEVIGDNFTVRNCDFDVALDVDGYGGSVYLNDWRYDTVTAQSYVKQYTIENNRFQHDMNITIASGVGMTGDVSTRRITGNTFEFDPAHTATAISFSGAGGVPWYVYPVGGAVIENNSFQGGTQYIRARGEYKESEFDWEHFWQANTFDKAVVPLVDYPATPFNVRAYSYTTSGYTFTNVRRIGAVIQNAIDNAQSGDTIRIAVGTYIESLNIYKALTLEGASRTGVVIDASSFADYGIDAQGNFAFTFKNFTLDGPDGNVSGRYGLKVWGDNATAIIEDVSVTGAGSSGIDLNGLVGGTVRNVSSVGALGGAGIALSDCSNIALENITTNGNAWGGIALYTKGEYSTGGSDNISLLGTNSFGEPVPLYIEVDNFTSPTNPYPVTNFTQSMFPYLVTNSAAPAYTLYQMTAAGAAALANVLPLPTAPQPEKSIVTVLPTGSIQAAIDAADSGDTIKVAAGTYAENLSITKHIKLVGAGNGSDPANSTIIHPVSGNVVSIGASGVSADNPLLLKEMRIEPYNSYGINLGNSQYVRIDHVEVVGQAAPDATETEVCFKVATTADVSNLAVESSAFRNCAFGWYIAKDMPPTTASNFKNISVTNSAFTGNDYKGLYIEKMSDAIFASVTIANNGLVVDSAIYFNVKWNAGVDVNLKAQAYQNLRFYNLAVTNNAIGAQEGAGVMIKARDDGGYVAPNAATLTNVLIEGGVISGNERGIRFGEPAKNNAGPAATVRNVSIFGNVLAPSSPAGSAGGGLINQAQAQIDARNNWWGAISGPSGLGTGSGDAVVNLSTGSVLFDPWTLAAPAVLSVPADPIVLQRTDPKVINVPVILTPEPNSKVASVAFSVDYDQGCLISDIPKVTGLPAGFQHIVSFDAADTDGEIDIAIWSESNPPQSLTVVNLLSIQFTVLDGCWGTDRTVDVLFSSQPAPSFGNTSGQTLSLSSAGASIPLDFNSTPTGITLSATSVAENVLAGTVVGTFLPVDADGAGDPYTYSFVTGAGDTDNASFTIVGGQLKINASPDFESKSSYSILVQVNDGKGGIFSQSFTITITNVNEAPTDISLTNDKVFEAAPVNTVIGTFSTSDQDDGDTHTYSLVAGSGDADNGAFTITGNQLSINASPDFDTKSSYSIRVRSTDSGSPSLSFEKEFTIHVIDRSELSLPVETDLVWVAYSGNLQVPVRFAAKGNAVRSASFSIDYNEACLTFTGLSDSQSGWSGSAGTPTTSGVGIALNGSADLASGVAVVLNFSANDACYSGEVTPFTFVGTTSLADVSSGPLPVLTHDGAVHIVANDARGDCNSDDIVNAADFVAEVLESFDANTVPASLLPNHWLYVHTGNFVGSAIGCDANASTQVDVADILCTVLVVFGDNACTLPAVTTAAGQPAILSLPAAPTAPAGATVEIPVSLRRNGAAVAGAAFRIGIDPQVAVIDMADADNNGIPDGIRFNVPANLMRSVQVREDGTTVDIAIADLSLPLFELPDDVLVTVDLQVTAAGAGRPVVASLANASLGSTSGVNVPVEIEVAGQEAANQLFLPIMRR